MRPEWYIYEEEGALSESTVLDAAPVHKDDNEADSSIWYS